MVEFGSFEGAGSGRMCGEVGCWPCGGPASADGPQQQADEGEGDADGGDGVPAAGRPQGADQGRADAPAMKLTAMTAVFTRARPSVTTAKSRAEIRTFIGKMATCNSTIATMISVRECWPRVATSIASRAIAQPAPVAAIDQPRSWRLTRVLCGDRAGETEEPEYPDGQRRVGERRLAEQEGQGGPEHDEEAELECAEHQVPADRAVARMTPADRDQQCGVAQARRVGSGRDLAVGKHGQPQDDDRGDDEDRSPAGDLGTRPLSVRETMVPIRNPVIDGADHPAAGRVIGQVAGQRDDDLAARPWSGPTAATATSSAPKVGAAAHAISATAERTSISGMSRRRFTRRPAARSGRSRWRSRSA